jgi:monothiol glutaredoxin
MAKIHTTEAAQKAIKLAAAANQDAPLRLAIDADFDHQLYFDQRTRDDEELLCGGGLTLIVDVLTAQRADGMTIDYVDQPGVAGFKIENPNAPPRVKQLPPEELKAMFDAGEKFELLDVRSPEERELAKLPNSRLLDQNYVDELLNTRDKNTTLVFQCHHGIRSQSAAEYFLGQGFRKLYNLRGGIDAWSIFIDPTVPRY